MWTRYNHPCAPTPWSQKLVEQCCWELCDSTYHGLHIMLCNISALAISAMHIFYLSQDLIDILWYDHFCFCKVLVFHVRGHIKRNSAVLAVGNATIDNAMPAFESCWTRQFLILRAIHVYESFTAESIPHYCKECDRKWAPVHPDCLKRECHQLGAMHLHEVSLS